MDITVCKSKIHRATVTDTNIAYEGSITISPKLMDLAGIYEYEQVHVVNVNNGERFVTYVIRGKNDNEIILNGAAARLAVAGDKVIIIAYTMVKEKKMTDYKPSIVLVDDENQVIKAG